MQAVELLLLLLACHGAPVVAARLFGSVAAWPVDAGMLAWDGRRWLGTSKTWRGLIASLLAAMALSYLYHWPVIFGVWFAVLAMLGDLFSSFVKRRLGKESSSRFTLLDQIPESALPLVYAWYSDGFSSVIILQVVVMFFLVELFSSPILFWLGIRRRPH
ncbi:MAG: CDP-archaeol synthase [Hahellaceae bacterium]|nr:CDP-archaeol synthase [Hahellaceae bacterium]MCP5168606.1 CDP-archaeol synthase [Hahellaceae bacterium]